MADVVRHIGLSLGADICWPLCFEHILKRLDLKIAVPVAEGGGTMTFEVERVSIEPFDLQQPCKYDVVIDRLTHWYHTSREWIKKSILMDDLYVFNNPWSVQANEKHTSYAAMMKLGMPIPKTWMIPPKTYDVATQPDVRPTLHKYAKLFDLTKVGEAVGFPLFLKPYDGGGWRAVTRVKDAAALKKAYDESGKMVMHAQASVEGFDLFVRCIGFGPQARCVAYDASQPLHDRYTMKTDFMSAADVEHLRKVTMTINAFFGWEFNSCEALRVVKDPKADGKTTWYPIDFANPCPDSQVTSLHFHFPWLVKAYLRWAIFCAATKRKMRRTPDWEPFLAIAAEGDAKGWSYEQKLDKYAALADKLLAREEFEAFCAKHLSKLDAVTDEFFGTPEAKDAVRQKTAALFPAHEVEKFTELFWQRIQGWRAAGGP